MRVTCTHLAKAVPLSVGQFDTDSLSIYKRLVYGARQDGFSILGLES
jgi:hypothetical protein